MLVLDEAPRPGGQIYRQLRPSSIPRRATRWAAPGRRAGPCSRTSSARARRSGPAPRCGRLPDRVLLVNQADRAAVLRAGALVLAVGAYDRPAAIPGWTLPGVVTAGGVTALVRRSASCRGAARCSPAQARCSSPRRRRWSTGAPMSSASPKRRRRALLGLLRRPWIAGQRSSQRSRGRRSGPVTASSGSKARTASSAR